MKIWGTLAVFAVVVLAIGLRLLKRDTSSRYPYRRVASLLTPAERQFAEVLGQAIPDRCGILAKVRLADLFIIEADGTEWWRAFGRVSNKHVDFLLVDSSTWEPLLAIELDDASHRRPRRRERDRLVNQICTAGGLPLWRVPVRRQWHPQEVAAEIARLMESASAGA